MPKFMTLLVPIYIQSLTEVWKYVSVCVNLRAKQLHLFLYADAI